MLKSKTDNEWVQKQTLPAWEILSLIYEPTLSKIQSWLRMTFQNLPLSEPSLVIRRGAAKTGDSIANAEDSGRSLTSSGVSIITGKLGKCSFAMPLI